MEQPSDETRELPDNLLLIFQNHYANSKVDSKELDTKSAPLEPELQQLLVGVADSTEVLPSATKVTERTAVFWPDLSISEESIVNGYQQPYQQNGSLQFLTSVHGFLRLGALMSTIATITLLVLLGDLGYNQTKLGIRLSVISFVIGISFFVIFLTSMPNRYLFVPWLSMELMVSILNASLMGFSAYDAMHIYHLWPISSTGAMSFSAVACILYGFDCIWMAYRLYKQRKSYQVSK